MSTEENQNLIYLDHLSDEELDLAIAKRKAMKQKAIETERKLYETKKEDDVLSLSDQAEDLHLLIKQFKTNCLLVLEAQKQKLDEYGAIRKNSQGGFSIENSDSTKKIVRVRATKPTWDERAKKGVDLIKDFLQDTVKKRDKDAYEIMMTFIAKKSNGELEYDKVMQLLQHENRFDDVAKYPNQNLWSEGLRLIKESYKISFKGYQVRFEKKNEEGKYETIDLNFATV
jgi:ribosomal protein L31E